MKPRWLTAVVALSAALMTLDMTVVTIALPDITREFSAGLEDAQWIVNAYVLVFAALLLGVGALSDRMPRHRLFMLGHLIFAASSLLCALSGSSGTLIAGRVCQAVGATLVFGTCMPLIADTHEGDDAARGHEGADGAGAGGGRPRPARRRAPRRRRRLALDLRRQRPGEPHRRRRHGDRRPE